MTSIAILLITVAIEGALLFVHQARSTTDAWLEMHQARLQVTA